MVQVPDLLSMNIVVAFLAIVALGFAVATLLVLNRDIEGGP